MSSITAGVSSTIKALSSSIVLYYGGFGPETRFIFMLSAPENKSTSMPKKLNFPQSMSLSIKSFHHLMKLFLHSTTYDFIAYHNFLAQLAIQSHAFPNHFHTPQSATHDAIPFIRPTIL